MDDWGVQQDEPEIILNPDMYTASYCSLADVC